MKKAYLSAIPLLALAACGGAGADNKAKAPAAADSLQPGQYEVTAEVTDFRSADDGRPKIDTPKGTRSTRSVCVAGGSGLPADLFADQGFECRDAGQGFASGGTINSSFSCGRYGLPTGEIGVSVSGTFGADSFEVQRQLITKFTTDGDVVIATRLQGRRTGECSAAPAGAPKGK